jgi:uncharacterized membrane protein YphA (DoxX/SURF4 family)
LKPTNRGKDTMTEPFGSIPADQEGITHGKNTPVFSGAPLVFSARTYVVLRWMLCMVFLGSGFIKLMDLKAFATLIGDFGLLPERFHFPAALFFALAEMIAGSALVFDIRGSLGALAGLLLFFMGVLGYGVFMGFDMDCGCFGPSGIALFSGLEGSLYRDALFMAVIGYLYLWRKITFHSPMEIRDFLSSLPLERKNKPCKIKSPNPY